MENLKFKNKGKIWANTRKEKTTQPDWKGKGNFNGVEFEISAWYQAPNSEDENGSFSITFQEPYVKDAPAKKSEFSARNFAIGEADKMFSKDIEKEYEDDNDDLIF